MNMDISLCMIVKNEEKLLASTIESVKSHMGNAARGGIEDIVVVDTGSADRTREIALQCGARVFDFEWRDDFSAARNFAAGKAENDWIFFLDADEVIAGADMKELHRLIDEERCFGNATMLELSDESNHPATRLYNRKVFGFTGRIHENLAAHDGKTEPKRVKIPVIIHHHGYLPEHWQSKEKFKRNVSMLEKAVKEHPDDPYYLYNLGKCYFIFGSDLGKACGYFEQALRKCDDGDIHLDYIYKTVECYGYSLINTGKYREALNLLEVYYPHYKGNPNFRFLAAHIYQNNAMFIEAVECYESCVGADMLDTKGITSFLSLYNIGVILECLEMTQDAIEMYESCGDYGPAQERLKALGKR